MGNSAHHNLAFRHDLLAAAASRYQGQRKGNRTYPSQIHQQRQDQLADGIDLTGHARGEANGCEGGGAFKDDVQERALGQQEFW